MDDEPNCERDISVHISEPARSRTADPPGRSSDGKPVSGVQAVWAGIRKSLTSSVSVALERHRVRTARVHITVVTDEEIAALNGQYLGCPCPTDVLSFDLGDSRRGAARTAARPDHRDVADAGRTIEGDIVVSLDTAAREARARGHGVADELSLYAVHGALHLLGYDDGQPSEAGRMHELENELLAEAGIGRIYGAQTQ